MKTTKLRRIAWHIEHNRAYLIFDPYQPDLRWPVTRGTIPRHLWWSRKWIDTHLVQPTLRQRMRWSAEQLSARGALPEPFSSMQSKFESLYAQQLELTIHTSTIQKLKERRAVHQKISQKRYSKKNQLWKWYSEAR